MDENSNVTSNRLVKNKDVDDKNFSKKVQAKYLESNKTELNKSTVFKKPHRATDICDYCEKRKELAKKIVKKLKILNYDWQETDDIRFVKHFLAQKTPEFSNSWSYVYAL